MLIDCSTIEVATAARVAEIAKGRGLHTVDAPASSGIAAAAGGTEDAYALAELSLPAIGRAASTSARAGA